MGCRIKSPGRAPGFTLAEFVLAIALAAVALLSLVAVSLSALRSNRKATDTTTGYLLAEQVVEQTVYGMQANTLAPIWNHNLPAEYSLDVVNLNNQDFTVIVYARDPVAGLVAPHRLKRIEVVARWWDAQSSSTRSGMGRLEARSVRLVREP
ncbi:MAG: hypothetical protein U0931_31990 [Vulcanimicrobiota bacterium]